MISLLSALVASIAKQSNHGRNRENDVEFDHENEPIIKMLEPDESRTACHDNIRNELSEENKPERLPSQLIAAKPAPDWPEEQPASIKDDSYRGKEDSCESVAHVGAAA